MNKFLITIIILTAFTSCGGSGTTTASDNPPNVAGSYACTDGCSGTCNFDDEILVLQSGDDFIIRSDSYDDHVGSINNDGEFSTSSNLCECDGQFISNTGYASCTCQGTSCQTVYFTAE